MSQATLRSGGLTQSPPRSDRSGFVTQPLSISCGSGGIRICREAHVHGIAI
jgi:hypothetical protein